MMVRVIQHVNVQQRLRAGAVRSCVLQSVGPVGCLTLGPPMAPACEERVVGVRTCGQRRAASAHTSGKGRQRSQEMDGVC